MVCRAAALLEHHLETVIQERDPQAKMTLSVKIQLNKFAADVASTYNGAKFHSLSHAMHVTTSMNKLVSLVATDESALNKFSLVFSAFLHDAGHTGKQTVAGMRDLSCSRSMRLLMCAFSLLFTFDMNEQ